MFDFLVSILLGMNSPLQAQAQLVKPMGSAEKIVVRGFRGRLVVQSHAGDEVRLEGRRLSGSDGTNIFMREKGNAMEIQVESSSEDKDWENWQQKPEAFAEYEIRLHAPAKPIEVSWGDGRVEAEGLLADLSVQMTKGEIRVSKGRGHLRLQNMRGKTTVQGHQGAIEVQSFQGQVNLEAIVGRVQLSNYAANLRLLNVEGPVHIRNHSGAVTGDQLTGQVQVNNVSGGLKFEALKGSLTGELQGGRLAAKFLNLQSLNLSADEAQIQIDAPSNSAALVTLRTERGKVSAPNHLSKQSRGRWTERKGQLRGEEQGHIKIVSKYGDIVLR